MKFFIITIFLFCGFIAFGQVNALRKIDNELTASIKKEITSDEGIRDSLATVFQKLLLKDLADPVTFTGSLDSLSKWVEIKYSADNQIKFYSWDDYTGGTWHNINCVTQFRSENGKVIVQQLNSGNEGEKDLYTDSGIYEVHVVTINGKTSYLTFGWGTHGAGMQHSIVRVFQVTGPKLTDCTSCFANDSDLVIEYPRAYNLKLNFDPLTNEISYTECIEIIDSVSPQPIGKTIVLQLRDGKFTEK
ncbi:MAG: hypothetical protein HY064_06650 [Bacteroidetes bacterium]|nr:hypothetical protein [Bacteroidota bacterium]